jgi:hypothetical protein
MAKLLKLLVAALFMANLAAGCTTHRTVETTHYQDRRTGEPVTVERHTTTTTETSTTGDTGVVSGTVNVIGEVLALPFRAVGGLLRAIF